jgi:hypothetical protein
LHRQSPSSSASCPDRPKSVRSSSAKRLQTTTHAARPSRTQAVFVYWKRRRCPPHSQALRHHRWPAGRLTINRFAISFFTLAIPFIMRGFSSLSMSWVVTWRRFDGIPQLLRLSHRVLSLNELWFPKRVCFEKETDWYGSLPQRVPLGFPAQFLFALLNPAESREGHSEITLRRLAQLAAWF